MKTPRIHKNLFAMIVLVPLLLASSGCIYLVVGGIGAVGGYIVSPDTVEGITDNEADIVWDTAIETLSVMGLIEEQDEAAGMILASVPAAKITVTMVTLSESTTKLTVKARKAFLPRISLAQDVFVKIMSRVKEQY